MERRLGLRSWFLVLAVAALALPIGITWAQDAGDASPVARRDVHPARDDEQTERLPPVQAPVPGTPALPTQPVPYFGPVVPGGYTSYVPYTPQAAAAPAQPPAYPAAGAYGFDQESRSAAEMGVRQAELDLKARRIKARQAQNAIKSMEEKVKTASKAAGQGNAPISLVNEAKSSLENAIDEAELAKVEVERAELAVEQAKRRMTSYNRIPSNNYPLTTPRSNNAPALAPPAAVINQPAFGPGSMPPVAPGGGYGVNLPRSGDAAPLATTPAPGMRRSSGSADGGYSGADGMPTPSARGGFAGSGGLGGSAAPGGVGFGGGAAAGPGSSPFGGRGGVAGSGGGGFGGGMARSSDPFFRNFDRRGSGKIERNDVPEWMRERFFEIVDTNKDGVVDEGEFNANYSKLWDTGRSTASAPIRASGRGSPTGETRPARDPRDERIKQLEEELKELRKSLDSIKKPVSEAATR